MSNLHWSKTNRMGDGRRTEPKSEFYNLGGTRCLRRKKMIKICVIFCVEVTLGNVIVKYLKGRTVNTIGNPENIEYKSKYKFKY